MTVTESIDLFSFDTRRHRVVEWQAPVAKAASGMSGLETMCAIRDGILPPPPMARLIGFEMRIAEAGRIVMELDPDESLENTIGLLHGATAAALLDTAMGCAIATMQPAGQTSVTLDFKLTYLRPLSVRSGRVSAGRQGGKTRPPDQLCRRLRPRRRGQSCSARDCDIYDDRR
jgi:uncharacterized protein (TIGR00369 family)